MTLDGAQGGPPGRDEAVRGVEERLAATVHAYPGLRLISIPAQFLSLPEAVPRGEPGVLRSAAYPGRAAESVGEFFPVDAGGHRVLRGGRLPDLAGEAADEVYDVVRDLWESAGCRVDDATGLDGRMLVVHDPAGYVLALTRHGGDDPILTVGSPPLNSRFIAHGLWYGLAAGLAVGCLGPCVSSVGPVATFPSLAGLAVPFYGWVPLFLLVSGLCLVRPETRRFGVGLLISGAVVGVTVAGIVTG